MSTLSEDLGARVASVWEGLRPATRNLVERALQSTTGMLAGASSQSGSATQYDPRADWELSRLLAALDERALEGGVRLDGERETRRRRMADTTASVLQNQTRSAEVFSQLVERAERSHDYARVDLLADALASRFAPSEICEITRQPNPLVRALAHEALTQTPPPVLLSLLADPVDADVAREALARQAFEFGSEEARQILGVIESSGISADEL